MADKGWVTRFVCVYAFMCSQQSFLHLSTSTDFCGGTGWSLSSLSLVGHVLVCWGFLSLTNTPTNPWGRNTADRVQRDSSSMWQIQKMDFSACQNKQYFSAWGSERDSWRGVGGRWQIVLSYLTLNFSSTFYMYSSWAGPKRWSAGQI